MSVGWGSVSSPLWAFADISHNESCTPAIVPPSVACTCPPRRTEPQDVTADVTTRAVIRAMAYIAACFTVKRTR